MSGVSSGLALLGLLAVAAGLGAATGQPAPEPVRTMRVWTLAEELRSAGIARPLKLDRCGTFAPRRVDERVELVLNLSQPTLTIPDDTAIDATVTVVYRDHRSVPDVTGFAIHYLRPGTDIVVGSSHIGPRPHSYHWIRGRAPGAPVTVPVTVTAAACVPVSRDGGNGFLYDEDLPPPPLSPGVYEAVVSASSRVKIPKASGGGSKSHPASVLSRRMKVTVTGAALEQPTPSGRPDRRCSKEDLAIVLRPDDDEQPVPEWPPPWSSSDERVLEAIAVHASDRPCSAHIDLVLRIIDMHLGLRTPVRTDREAVNVELPRDHLERLAAWRVVTGCAAAGDGSRVVEVRWSRQEAAEAGGASCPPHAFKRAKPLPSPNIRPVPRRSE